MAGSVANARKANTSGSNTTTTTSFTGTTGNTIWVGVSDASGQGALTISDNVVGSPNTYTQIGTTQTSASGAQIRRFRCQNITGRAGMTVTATWGSNSDATVHVLELAGVATASLDAPASAQTDDSNPPWTVTSGTLAQADSIAIALTGSAFNGTWSESSGFTVQTQEGDNNLYWTGCAASRVVAATTALTPSFTISGGGSDCAVAIDVFKAAAAGGVTGTAAWTEADDVAALTGVAEVAGSAVWTESDDIAALTGAAEVTGASAWTEADDATAIAGTASIDGSLDWTEEDDTADISGVVGTLAVSGEITWTEQDDTASLTGTSSTAVHVEVSYSAPSKRKKTYNYDYSSPKPAIVEPAKVEQKPAKKAKKSVPADVAEMLQLLESSQTLIAQVLAEQKAMRAAEVQILADEQEMLAVIACCL